MRNWRRAIVLGAIAMGLATTAFAQPRGDWHGGIRDRVGHAQARIDRGIRDGSLTRQEAGRLQRELNAVLNRADRMRRDGRLDPREREVLHDDLSRLERNISREKRDGDYRGRPRGDYRRY
jgi:hypothetical protein